ncbi:MAG: hypothetical protein EBQ71_06400, partial [Betaproteobacteria bacterium]|nr:hypothetical protein [Betaproteobacteria bacterium]
NTATTSGIAVAAAINAISGNTNVTATVAATTTTGAAAAGFATALAASQVVINGVDIGAIAAAGTAIARGGQMAAAINAKTSQTGVTATFSTSTGAVGLTAADGRNIDITLGTVATGAITGLGSQAISTTTVTRSKVSLSSAGAAGISISGIAANGLAASGLSEGFSLPSPRLVPGCRRSTSPPLLVRSRHWRRSIRPSTPSTAPGQPWVLTRRALPRWWQAWRPQQKI